MQIQKAVITAGGPAVRTLPLQSVVDRDGTTKTALSILIEELLEAGIESIGVVINTGDEAAYEAAAGLHSSRLTFLCQDKPLGYAHAISCSAEFTGNDPFLLMVGDHLYLSYAAKRCAKQLVEVAQAESCAVSAVEATHESKLPFYGAVGGRLVDGSSHLYQVDTVLEKPTPTEAEQKILVPGLRAGYYLCFFGMHVLTPSVQKTLRDELARAKGSEQSVHFRQALAILAERERYIACELNGVRYNIGVRYGLFNAQLALAMAGVDRDEVLTGLVEVMATARS